MGAGFLVRLAALAFAALTLAACATQQLRVVAAKPGANPHRVEASLKARTCTEMPLMVPPA